MTRVRPAIPTVLTPQKVLCPYCGQISADPRRCDACRGFFDPLSRQATQNAMGPWFIKDDVSPWRPGCSIETLREMVRRGKVTRDTILRGPGTKQFWNFAGRTPSIANLLGVCHNCRVTVKPDDYSCKSCGAVFTPDADRQHLGLAPVHFLPGEASPEIVAAASMDTPAPASAAPVAAEVTSVVIATREVPASPVQQPVKVVKVERSGSGAAPWLIGITVVVLLGMGVVVALVAMGKLTIPGLNDPVPAVAPASIPAKSVPATEQPTPEPKPTTTSEVPAANPVPAQPAPADTSPTGQPSPTGSETKPPEPVAPPEPANPTQAQTDMRGVLLPLLRADPFNLDAIQQRIAELRRDNPGLSADLDAWEAAAKLRAQQIRLRKLP